VFSSTNRMEDPIVELEAEKRRLQRLVAELLVDNQRLRERNCPVKAIAELSTKTKAGRVIAAT
jgi:hypothetical protein